MLTLISMKTENKPCYIWITDMARSVCWQIIFALKICDVLFFNVNICQNVLFFKVFACGYILLLSLQCHALVQDINQNKKENCFLRHRFPGATYI